MLRKQSSSLTSPILQTEPSFDTIQSNNIIEFNWFGTSYKSIIPPMPNTNSRGIYYSEWYSDNGDGTLSKNEAELPNEYRDCILNLNMSSTCKLPNGLSFKVIEYLAEGKTGILWLVQFINDEHKYVLKFGDIWRKCGNIQLEFRLIYLLHEPDLKMPHIHSSIPFYWFNTSCFIFISYIQDSWLLNDLNLLYVRPKIWSEQYPSTFTQYTFIKAFNDIDDGILDFFIKCYKDILRVLKAMYLSLHVLYNDLHPGNIFVNNMDHSCYLIDFGTLFHRQIVTGNQRGKNLFQHGLKYKCERISCDPISHYNLRYKDDRNAFRWLEGINMTDIEAANVLMQYGMNGLRYNLFSKLLHIFIQYYADTILREYDKETSALLLKMNKELMHYCVGPSKDVLQRVWCRRNEMIKILELKTNDLQNSTNSETLKLEFWRLVHEIYAEDTSSLNCSDIPTKMKCD